MSLTVNKLSFGYHCYSVLKEINFTLKEGNLVCVLGKNGAGKSTLFRCILGILNDYQGEILLDGKNIKTYKSRELASKIAYIPQNHQATFAFTVLDMVLMGTTSTFFAMSNPGDKQKKVALNALRSLNLEHLAMRSYAHISGGEQQLVLIARAIAQQAKVLIMDEPCSNLDYGNQIRVMEVLTRLAREGYLILLSTHNPEHAFLYGNQALLLMEGQLAALGEPGKVMTQELLEKMYDVPIQVYEMMGSNQKICIPKRANKKGERYVEAV